MISSKIFLVGFLIGIASGLIIGIVLGCIIMALCVTSSKEREKDENIQKDLRMIHNTDVIKNTLDDSVTILQNEKDNEIRSYLEK